MASPHRARRLLFWSLGLLLGVPLGLVVAALLVVLIGANTGPGRRLIEQQAASLSGDLVAIEGLHGRFPDALAIDRLTLKDRLGAYAVLDGLALDWRPWRLLGRTARIDRVSVERALVLRKPVAAAGEQQNSSKGSGSLPDLGIDIRLIHVGALTLDRGVAGVAASLGLDGHVRIATIKPLLSGVSIATLPDSDVALDMRRLDQPGALSLRSEAAPGRLALHLHASDPKNGLIAALAGAPMLDPLVLALDLDGPRTASAVRLALAAGPVRLDANGSADLLTRRFDVVAHGHAPAMQPRPGIEWAALALDAHLTGTASAPAGSGTLLLDGLAAPGIGVSRLAARFAGDTTGPATLHAVAEGLRIPGPQPALFAATPLTLDAVLHDEQPGRPIDLQLYHALAQVTGRVFTVPDLHGSLGITLPQLAPFAAAAGNTPLDGHAAIATRFSYANSIAVLGLGGTVAITGGQPQAVGLIGDDGRLGLTGSLAGQDLRLYGLALHGRAIDLDASGSDLSHRLDLRFGLHLPDLHAILPTLRGAVSLAGTAAGPHDDLATRIAADGEVGAGAVPAEPLRLALDAAHLPKAPEGHLSLDGSLDRAPLALAARLERLADGATHVVLDRLGWKSASGRADLTLPAGATLPVGRFDLRMTRLADVDRLVGQAVGGHLAATLQTSQDAGEPHPTLRIKLGGAVASRAVQIGALDLAGSVLDPAGAPNVNLTLRADRLRAASVSGGSLRLAARGPQDAVAVTATGAFDQLAGAPARLDAALLVDLPTRRVSVGRLLATAKGETVRLLAPARIGFGNPIEVDRLRASVAPAAGGAAPALLDLAGTLSPRLDLTVSIANLSPALARPFAPTLDATGVIAAEARLTGTPSRPDGTVHIGAHAVHLRSGAGAALPAANLEARAVLAGGTARIDARLAAGAQIGLSLAGTAPLDKTGAMDLRAQGAIDLAVANAVLGAQGRQAAGQLALDLRATGTLRQPALAGQVRLARGQFQDFAQGVRLTDMAALLTAHGDSIGIDQFTARAGDGTIEASGSIGALQPGLPVDLHITASKARPLSSDLLTAVLDLDLTARGQAATRLDLAGGITVDSAAINIPSGLPPSVAKLEVIRPGQKPPPAAGASGPVIGLDLTLRAPGQIFVRGHGLDAELGGRLTVAGTTAAPVIHGGFDMRHGTFSLAGVNLTFTKGRVGFDGSGVTHKIDPSLDFTAESFVADTVARLHVGGYADAPKITLSSTPPLPQDQVLALILFGQSTTQLSALQIASVAGALAELSGVGGGGAGVLGSVRNRLGLDRLAIGSGGANSSGASVEAGKYVARGVYVGARQSTSGGGTQAQVQIDLTRRLKLDTTIGSGGTVTGTTTPENDPGSSVALKYQFQY